MSKYLFKLSNMDIFKRVFPALVGKYTFEKSAIKDDYILDIQSDPVNCKRIKINEIAHGAKTNNQITLLITDYDVFAIDNHGKQIKFQYADQILSNLYMDNSGYEKDWKKYQLDQRNEVYEVDSVNNSGIYVEHLKKVTEIKKGLPKFTLEFIAPEKNNPIMEWLGRI